MIRWIGLLLICAPAWNCVAQQPALNQQQPAVSRQQAQAESGLESPWDVRSIITAIDKDTGKLKPLLAQLIPQQWYDQKGAPSTYILQLQTAQRQVNDIDVTTKMLSQKTEDLALALDEYFRLEALDFSARSLAEGARKYGPRGQADQLDALVASNFTNRERLRQYLKDLATSIEQNFKIADEEAQRCRGIISREPGSGASRSRKY
jgi:hypothetical protein